MLDRSPTPVAVIGIGCRLPGNATNPQRLWEILVDGRNVWSQVPKDRYNEAAFFHPKPDNNGTTNHHGGHFLDGDISAFDAAFFGISPAEAKSMDPQQRILLEVSYEAFENAGITIESLRGSNTAVFAAMFSRDYDRNVYKDTEDIPKYHTTGCGEAIMSNRISYTFDLRGLSVTLDTGCSGGLVALHQACQSLRAGEAELALACGVSIIIGPDQMIGMSNLHMLNENGRCYPFDVRGSGYGRGEGATAVVVKRLDDAVRDGDYIRAVLLNTGVNQDGRTNGITYPSQSAQAILQRSLYETSGLNPSHIKYIEAHGTGTVAGDVAELGAISEVFCKNRGPNDTLYVGSIKSNIGHLESSSGLAALVKTVLVLEKGMIPPNADYTKPKPALDFVDQRIKIPVKLETITDSKPLRASVNSFGYGGVNAHAILESFTPRKRFHALPKDLGFETKYDELCTRGAASSLGPHDLINSTFPKVVDKGKSSASRLFVLSANSQASIIHALSRLKSWAALLGASDFNLDSLAYQLCCRRSLLPYRHAFVASSYQEFMSCVSSPKPAVIKKSQTPPIVFVFTGQGAQWYAMGRSLLFQFPKFRDSIVDAGLILRTLGARWDLMRELLANEVESRINESEISQPATTALQIALVDLLTSFGVKPQTVIGHSSGEIAAAYTAGVLTQRAALKVSYLRGAVSNLCKRTMPVAGAMLSVGLDEGTILPLIDDVWKGTLAVACVNSPRSLTISGDKAAIDELAKNMDSKRVFNKILKVDTAYHSHHMLRVANAYLDYLGTTETSEIKNGVRFISTVTANEKLLDFDSSYWVENLVSKVRFSDAVYEFLRRESANKEKEEVTHLFVEIGPHSALRGPILQSLDHASKRRKNLYLSTLERNRDAVKSVLELVCQAFVHGHPLDFHAVNGIAESTIPLRLVGDLPPYAWDHQNAFWHESQQSREFRFRQYPYHDLLGIRIPGTPSLEPSWRYIIRLENLPWLRDHVIDGLTTFPGAGYLCMAIEAIQQVARNDKPPPEHTTTFVLQDVRFMKALILPTMPDTIELQMSFHSQQIGTFSWQEFRIYSVSQESPWQEHCRGRVRITNTDLSRSTSNALEALHRLPKERHIRYEAREVYDRLHLRGNSYGPCFASISHLQIANQEALCELTIPNIKTTMPYMYQESHVIHPTTLDAIMHSVVPLFFKRGAAGSVMPVSIEELILSSNMPKDPGKVIKAIINLCQSKNRSALADIIAFDAEATRYYPILSVRGITVLDVGTSSMLRTASLDMPRISYTVKWEEDFFNLKTGEKGEARNQMTLSDYLSQLKLKLSAVKVLQLGLFPLAVTLSLLGQLCDRENPSLLRYELAGETAGQWQQQRELLQDWDNFIHHCPISSRDFRSLDVTMQGRYDLILMSIEHVTSSEFEVLAANIYRLLRPYGQLLVYVEDSEPMTTDVITFNEVLRNLHFSEVNVLSTDFTYKAFRGHLAVYEATRDKSKLPKSQIVIVADSPLSNIAASALIHTLESQFNCSVWPWESVPLDRDKTYIILDDGKNMSLAQADAQHLQKINKLLSTASRVIWVIAAAEAADDTTLEGALIVGMARTARSEYENLSMITLEVTDKIGDCVDELSQLLFRLLSNILDPSFYVDEIHETEYLYSNGKVLIPRLVPHAALNDHLVGTMGESKNWEAKYLRQELPLKLMASSSSSRVDFRFDNDDSLLGTCDPCEVTVEVRAHMMLTSHVLMEPDFMSTESATQREFAGIVTKVGAKANEKFHIGDRVCAWGLDTRKYPSYARTRAERVFHLPDTWSMVAAASLPIAFTSAYYTLRYQANLQNGHTLVIRGPGHPTAQAAIVVSMKLGAQTIVIAATAAQRQEIISRHSLPASCVLVDSGTMLDRTVIQMTKGKGADVVLSPSSSAPACDLSALVRVHGTIIQITEPDIGRNYVGNPSFLSKPCTLISFDFVTLAIYDPKRIAYVLKEVLDTFVEDPAFSTFNILTVPISNLGDALTLARTGKSSSRIILTADESTNVDVIHIKENQGDLRTLASIDNATYIVAGGLGDIGKTVCRLLASLGAACIVALSRRNLEHEQVKLMQDELRGHSAEVRFFSLSCDISEQEALVAAVRTIEQLGLPPIKGVVHSAAVLQDRVLERMTPEDFKRPLLTKISGTRNLDQALRDKALDFFIMLSSLSGIIGSRGQANYAAGNVFQDNFAQKRRGSQTRYVTLDLGMIEETSTYTTREGRLREQNLLRQGCIPIKQDQLVALLKCVLSKPQSQDFHQVVVGIDGRSIKDAENATPTVKSAMFAHVRGGYDTTPSVEGQKRRQKLELDHLESETIDEVARAVTEIIGRHLAGLVLLEPEKLEYNVPLLDFGLDSLTAIDLKNFIHREFNATIQPSEIIDEGSLAGLGNRVVARSTRFGKVRTGKQKDSEESSPDVSLAGIQEVFESANDRNIYHKSGGTLPTLPLPELEEALDMYLSLARPFLSPESIGTTTKRIEDFKIQAGKDLHEYLVRRVQTPAIGNWQHGLQINGIYLARRQPIHPYGTFYCSHMGRNRNHSQSLRAAIISKAAYKFKVDLDAGLVKPDQMNKEPLCSSSLAWLFNACRTPQRTVDVVEKHDGNEHLIAMRRGHIFKIPLTEAGTPLFSKILANAFDNVIQNSQEPQPSVASLTADDRDSWATLRKELKSISHKNAEVLQMIEAAAFIICLDDDSPETPTNRSNNLLLGNPGDRWSDKTLQFVVCKNGSSGYICEHSMLDALSTRQLNAAVTDAILRDEPTTQLKTSTTATNSEPAVPITEHRFTLTPPLLLAIRRIEESFPASYPCIEYCKTTLRSLTLPSLRRHRIAPKAGIQLAIQLASFLHYGRQQQHPSWETMSLMPFHKGRLDWMQTVSPAMISFCAAAAAADDIPAAEERARLLREAATQHASTMSKISRGKGCMAYLEAMRELVRQDEGYEGQVPAIFEDTTWEMMKVTSARMVKTDATEGLRAQEAGFYMPAQESVLVHYEIREDGCEVYIQAMEGRASAFQKQLEKAAEIVVELMAM